MRRIIISGALVLAVSAFLLIALGVNGNGNAQGTYHIEFQNAFGLVTGAPFKVAGVPAGSITAITLDQKTLNADVTVQVTQKGFGNFRTDAYCQSRPQSLIGEYFVDCQPGQYGKALKPGATIPVKNTFSTIPADLLADVMRLPYRQRLSLIINELGAAVASRSTSLQDALARAVPALDETDNLLTLLANDSNTLQALTANSNSVITALANNSPQVARFIVEANNAASDTATQQANLRLTFAKLPGFLEQLRPALQKLDQATAANTPVLTNLQVAAAPLNRFLRDLPAFSRSSLPAIRSLGKASVTGKTAVKAAAPAVKNLNTFAKPVPELAKNLAIVLHDLDDRSRAVEPDKRSPGGVGYTGLEALLQYVFNQALAINTFGPFGHQLAVDGFINGACSPYASPATIAMNLKQNGASYRGCYSWLGPNQPGVNEPDPSNPKACVPDPGGAPPGQRGPITSACKLAATDVASAAKASSKKSKKGSSTNAGGSPATGATRPPTSSTGKPGLTSTLGKVVTAIGGTVGGTVGNVTAPVTGSGSGSGSSGSGSPSGGTLSQTQQLLNYLLAP